MRIASWNCQGMGKFPTVLRLKEICRQYLLDAIFLIKTKQSKDHITAVAVSLGFTNFYIVPPQGLSGGLALLWKPSIDITILYQDARLVDCSINDKISTFYLSCVYGHPDPQYRYELWERLQRLAVNRNEAWIMIGDFNQIRNNSEKIGGHNRDASTFHDFNNMMSTCDMLDLKHIGNKFSWSGQRSIMKNGIRTKELIQCCLDRVVLNTEWFSYFPASTAEFLEPIESDHRPIVVDILTETRVKRGMFRYDRRLADREGFMVRSVSYSVLVNGSPTGTITPKRGIRQGDPISPYLFLFVAEMLTQKMRQEEAKGNITSLSISNNGPRVTHLLFADDSLFFCKANQ
ncbi:PREDICTED: uncharacterized protein LOC104720672 [Camelina sativa]|uniref:Uncharacterized protein LOC104720672 n=1 Tax=Camelina sativa TaxID=90675 RepID=A0ABM0U6V9_CAMSA|nr:PREDICTED: uncharacterized protein LOC104720672 [Camelina sativa]